MPVIKNKKNKVSKISKEIRYLSSEEIVDIENSCEAWKSLNELQQNLSGYVGSNANIKKIEHIKKRIVLKNLIDRYGN